MSSDRRECRHEGTYPGAGFSDEERELLQAVDRYLSRRRRRFLAWHEVLRIFKALGYRKVAASAGAKGKSD